MGTGSKRIRVKIGILLMAISLLGGCTPTPENSTQEISWNLNEVPCTITLAETEIQGTCSHSVEGVNGFKIQEPQALSGLTVQHLQGEYTIQMAGLTQKRSGGVMEQSAFGRLFSALDGAPSAGLLWEGGQWSGELSTGEVITAETREDGTLLTLAVPAWQFTARFSSPEE